MARTRSDDDLLEDLPPLDDGEEEEERAPNDSDEIDPGLDDDDTDDEVASDLAIGDLLDPIRDEGGLDAEDARDLDVGTTEALEDLAQSREDDDIAGAPGEDLSIGVHDVPEEGAQDAEGENPSAESDEIDESALPAIDADDDGQEGIEQETIELPEEAPLPAWSALRWEQVPLPLVAEPMKALALRGGRVVVAGHALLQLTTDPSGALHVLPCSSPSLTTVLTGLALPDDGQPVITSEGDHEEGNNLIAFGSDRSVLARLWPDGGLRVSRDRGHTWVEVPKQDEVAGFCVDEQGVLLAASVSGSLRGILRSGDGLGWELQRTGAEQLQSWQRPLLMASRDGAVAVASLEGSIDLSAGGATDWARHTLPPWVTSIAFVPSSGRNVLVGTLFIEYEDKSYLFTIEPDGAVGLVADLSPTVGVGSDDEDEDSEGMGRAQCVLWDEGRGWLWVAGRFGLQAWRPTLAA